MEPTPLLEGWRIRKIYQDVHRTVEVLRDVDLRIEAGQILAIMGASGVGKSTLLHILGLLDRPTAGRVFYRGRDLMALGDTERSALRASDFGFIFQMFHLLPDLDAQENAMLPALVGAGVLGRQMPRARALRRSEDLLVRMGLGDRLHHRPSQLSGGEKQRVAIARALMNQPQVVFCDEPTGNLDPVTSDEIFSLLVELNRENRQTFVMVTHNPKLAAQAHRAFRMEDGRLVPVPPPEPPHPQATSPGAKPD